MMNSATMIRRRKRTKPLSQNFGVGYMNNFLLFNYVKDISSVIRSTIISFLIAYIQVHLGHPLSPHCLTFPLLFPINHRCTCPYHLNLFSLILFSKGAASNFSWMHPFIIPSLNVLPSIHLRILIFFATLVLWTWFVATQHLNHKAFHVSQSSYKIFL